MEDFVPLKLEQLTAGLSNIKPLVGGGGFAFVELSCPGLGLTTLGVHLEDCQHLQQVDLSGNQISDISALTALPHVVSLRLDSNKIEATALEALEVVEKPLPWCQRLNLSSNKLASLPSLRKLGSLRFLKLEANEIATLEGFEGHDMLEEVDLAGNKLTSLLGLGVLGSLRKLVLSENQLESLRGLDTPQLAHLDLSGNQLATLEFVEGAPNCKELKVTGNQVPAPAEANTYPSEVQRLRGACPCLTDLGIAGNPVGDLKSEILVCLPQLEVMDDAPVTQEDRDAAVEREQEIADALEEARRAAEEEAARIAAEEEEARLAAEEEARIAAEEEEARLAAEAEERAAAEAAELAGSG